MQRTRRAAAASGGARRRLIPRWPRFGPRFFRRRSARFGLKPCDSGTDELSGVLAGRRSRATSDSRAATRAYSRSTRSSSPSSPKLLSASRSMGPRAYQTTHVTGT